MTYQQDYYLKNKEQILLNNKKYRLRTNYDHMYKNIIIKCQICNKDLKLKSLRYHYNNNVCQKYIKNTTSPYNIIYQK